MLELLHLVPNPVMCNMHGMVLAAVIVVVVVAVVVVVLYSAVLFCNFNGKHWAIVGPKLSKSPVDPDYCGPHY